MIEITYKISQKIKIAIHKAINRRLYKNKVNLYGIPKLINRKKISLGNNVNINENVFLHGNGGIEIKSNVTLSYGVTILSTGYDTEEWLVNKARIHRDARVEIGENVWIGANTTILSGVQIADNCIIAAGSVVVSSLKEAGTLYAGVPAKKKVIPTK